MRNWYLERMEKLVKVSIRGSNINNYLKRVIKKKIYIVKLIPISYREIHVILKYSEYLKLLELKSIYEVSVLEYLGSKGMEHKINNNIILLFFMLLGLLGTIVLSNVIFKIDIIHSDSEIRELVSRELKKYDVVKYRFKKGYDELERIEDKILNSNKDLLEWIEISTYGTKYIVRIEERKLNEKEDDNGLVSIVSKKDAVIVGIDAIKGDKLKKVNDYVSKGEEVISGYITMPDNKKQVVGAKGRVYGEVWYQVNIDYPIVYQESTLTGRSKRVYALYFFNHRFGLFDFDNFRSMKVKSKVLIKNNFLDIKLAREDEYEANVMDEVYTEDIARVKAIDYIKDKLKRDNKDIIKIRDVKILDSDGDEDSIKFQLFVRVVEDIGEVMPIKPIDEGLEEESVN